MGEMEKVEWQKVRRNQIDRLSNSRNCLSAGKIVPPILGEEFVIKFSAPKHVSDAIAALGRTEDIKFSPNNCRLAVAAFWKNQIVVFEICNAATSSGRAITVTTATEFSSDYINQPHGIDFIDDEKIIVANRKGDATIFKLPVSRSGSNRQELELLGTIPSGNIVKNPGSVSITRKDQYLYEALICNNFTNKITRHQIDLSNKCHLGNSEVLLEKWLDIPDGVSVSNGWIAISNHNTSNVLLYRDSDELNQFSDPDGILRCVKCPHGLRFSSYDRFMFVADAGTPYVHIYTKGDSDWGGVRSPLKSMRVLTDDDFARGRHAVPGGEPKGIFHRCGTKGIDVDNSMSILVTTCEVQPMAFFDLARILERISLLPTSGDDAQRAFEVNYELNIQDELKQEIARIKNSRSWRLTAPLRWVGYLLGALR